MVENQIDEIVYQKQLIMISKRLARFGRVTYPMADIRNVRIEKPDTGVAMIICWLFAFVGITGMLAGTTSSRTIGWVFAIASGLIYLFIPEKPDKLILRTSSGDEEAYEAVDRDELEEIKSAIERARP